MSLSRGSIRRPVAVAMLFVAVALLGGISFVRLPIDLLPDVAYPRLVVYTENANVAPAEIERFITEPIEQQVSTVPGVQDVESQSREGVSLVTIRFAWGTDMDFAVLNVREKLDNLRDRLPELASRPTVLRTDPRSEPIMAVTVAGDVDLYSLKELAEAVFKRRFEQIDGVAQAAVTGGLEREIHVEVDAGRLDSYGVTIRQIADALDAANASAPGGTVRRGRYRYSLRTLGEFQTVDQIGDVVVRRPDATGGGPGGGDGGGGPGGTGAGGAAGGGSGAGANGAAGVITIADIATVDDGFEERESVARYDDRPAVGLLLFKESKANTVRVSERVREVMEQLRAGYDDVEIEVAMSQATFIADAISNVVQALVLGGILAFLVLFLFLRDARYPVAVALAIPISVIGAFALLDAVGVSLNIMSLGGLALGVGMLVDNSIVVLENIFRHHEEGAGAIEAAAAGAEEVQGAITASTLTTISVFGPIIYVEGVAGELFGALSFAVGFSLLASLLVALTLLPTMAARWEAARRRVDGGFVRRRAAAVGRAASRGLERVTRPLFNAFDRRFDRFAEAYHGWLEAALDHRSRVVAVTLAVFAVAVALGLTLDRGVLPDVDQGAFQMRLELARGTPLDETVDAADRLERMLLEEPGVAAVFTQVGRRAAVAGVPDDASGLHTAQLDVRLRRGVATADVVDRIRPALASYPPGAVVLETGQATALGRLLGGGEADLAVRVQGEDLDRMLEYGRALEARLARVGSLTNVRVGTELGQPEVRVEIDRERAAAFGIEPIAVAQTVEAYMRGTRATEFVAFDRKIPVVVRLPDSARRSLGTLDLLKVRDVPLRELVRTHDALGPTEIRRREQTRVVPVYADVAAGGLGDALADVSAVVASAPAPRGLRTEVGGENEEMRDSFRELGFAFGLALLLVYMIMAAQFESFVHPFTVLLAVPLASVGAVGALWLGGAGLNTMSLIGFVILVGIVVNDAIIKVDFINQARERGAGTRDAILEAGRVRLRPIVMTTVTTVLGLTPMALGIGRGADLRAPLAIAVIGGLITATALTLIVVPVAYDLIEDARTRALGLVGAAPGTGVPAGSTAASAGATAGRADGRRPDGSPVPAGGTGSADAFAPPDGTEEDP